jgi:hypothetical protein
MVQLTLTQRQAETVWAACFAALERERKNLGRYASYQQCERQWAADAAADAEALIRQLNPSVWNFSPEELNALIDASGQE